MDPALRVVTRLPIDELFDAQGSVSAERRRDLALTDVRQLLREGAVGAIVRLGEAIDWRDGPQLFAWWKAEAAPRFWAGSQEPMSLDDYDGGRAWSASEWRAALAARRPARYFAR